MDSIGSPRGDSVAEVRAVPRHARDESAKPCEGEPDGQRRRPRSSKPDEESWDRQRNSPTRRIALTLVQTECDGYDCCGRSHQKNESDGSRSTACIRDDQRTNQDRDGTAAECPREPTRHQRIVAERMSADLLAVRVLFELLWTATPRSRLPQRISAARGG